MKRTFISLLIAVCLLAPAMALAAGAGGNANKSELKCQQIMWHKDRTTAVADSEVVSLLVGSTGFGMVGLPETSQVYDASNWITPMGASAFLGFMATFAAATAVNDSIGVLVQWSPDNTNWFSVNTTKGVIAQLPTVGLTATTFTTGTAHNILVEAATMPTSAMWRWVRFIAQHWDGVSVATTIASFRLWVCHYEKVE